MLELKSEVNAEPAPPGKDECRFSLDIVSSLPPPPEFFQIDINDIKHRLRQHVGKTITTELITQIGNELEALIYGNDT